ncbi:MAG: tRNA (adenosine(37)-N6)-threonylcarbamoyltransferase complex dimerization subunit type 1 TsaB, partial [Candidatus Dadabacteria bacterium]
LKANNLVCVKEIKQEYSHIEKIGVVVEEILMRNKIKPSQIEAIVVGKGPGSFTGLRIGYAFSKGFCFAKRIPLYQVSTLESLAYQSGVNDSVVISILDARRGEFFCAAYLFAKGRAMRLGEERIVSKLELYSLAKEQNKKVYFVSSDVEVLKDFNMFDTVVVEEVSRGLLKAFEASLSKVKDGGKGRDFNLAELAKASPNYLRAPAAKTLEERLADRSA